jgi:hypothetical protein
MDAAGPSEMLVTVYDSRILLVSYVRVVFFFSFGRVLVVNLGCREIE